MKKILAVILLVSLFASMLAVFPAASDEADITYILHSGDVDGDGAITPFDYLTVKRAHFGTLTLSVEQSAVADIDRDGSVNEYDYVFIKRAYFGTYTIEPGDTVGEPADELVFVDNPNGIKYAVCVLGSTFEEDFADSEFASEITVECDGEKLYIIENEEDFLELNSYVRGTGQYQHLYSFYELDSMLPDGFFDENLLVFKHFTEPTLGYEYDIINVSSDQDGITLNYKRIVPFGEAPTEEQETLVAVALSKADVADEKTYDVVVTDYIKPEDDEYPVIRLSGISDITDDSASRTYCVSAPYSDTYSITSPDVTKMVLYAYGEPFAEGTNSLSVELYEGGIYMLYVETASPNAKFDIKTEAQNHLVTLPYDVAEPLDVTDISLDSNDINPLTPAEINYQKREGGTYIYSNNPELIPADSVGDAFIRTENLTGEVYFTFEHANYSNVPIYLGYQIKNEGDTDVYITVTNIGYQAGGTWFGQLAWYDFYNTSFELPDDYFTATGAISGKYSGQDYAYQNYTPRVFQPITYRLPAGEAFYVIGGTTSDAYNNINVDNSANKLLPINRCANGNVKFNVSGGEVTATFYAYSNVSQVAAEPEATGYRVGAYAGQYLGTADHSGVIDNYITWTFNDKTSFGSLPVTYTNRYSENVPAQTTPYAAYNSVDHTVEKAYSWMTHLNPQNDHRAVGTDIVEFTCVDSNGRAVVIDNDHADGAGNAANTANWMIEYQDHFTLINQGDRDRKIKLNLNDNGTLAILIRDSLTGEVIDTAYTAGLAENGNSFVYEITVPAHSVQQITLDYLLVACSYGSVIHSATLS